MEKSQGRSFKDKTPIFGIYHRETRTVKTFVIPNTRAKTIKPLIYDYIEMGSTVYTDEWSAYTGIGEHYDHDFVNHRAGNYAKDDVTTNAIENFWSNLKRTLKGSYIQVSKKYLYLYAEEVQFRFNHRNKNSAIFSEFLELLSPSQEPCLNLTSQ